MLIMWTLCCGSRRTPLESTKPPRDLALCISPAEGLQGSAEHGWCGLGLALPGRLEQAQWCLV